MLADEALATIADEIDPRFAVRIEAAVYKIVEEALTNVMRHASARSVTISLTQAGDTLTVVLADDGEGFEPEHRSLTPGRLCGIGPTANGRGRTVRRDGRRP